MKYSSLCIAVSLMLLTAGCASGPPFIDGMQPDAISMATRRGQFEMNCPAATGELISRENVQPISFRFGVERAEYTIGVSGCGKRATYVVICPDEGSDSSCFAAGGNTAIQ